MPKPTLPHYLSRPCQCHTAEAGRLSSGDTTFSSCRTGRVRGWRRLCASDVEAVRRCHVLDVCGVRREDDVGGVVRDLEGYVTTRESYCGLMWCFLGRTAIEREGGKREVTSGEGGLCSVCRSSWSAGFGSDVAVMAVVRDVSPSIANYTRSRTVYTNNPMDIKE